ncbi:MAG: tyrosine-type recombinase/integrase [Aliishimia sp.]
MRKLNEENERIKRLYLQYLRTAKGRDQTTVVKAAEAILRFEASTKYASFKKFRIEQVLRFRDKLNSEISKISGKPLAKSTIASILAANKAFLFWLADKPGYRSRIRHSDADYFNMDAKGARVAHTVRETPYPSLDMARHTFGAMPTDTEIQRRDRAVFAFLMITGARDGAISSLRLKHINLIDGYVYQDAREVRTKASKSITTYFLPIDPIYSDCFTEWVRYLQQDKLFGPDDALFPPPEMGHVSGEFRVTGLKRETYRNANAIRQVIRAAFVTADLPTFTPHAFRKTLVKWAEGFYPTIEGFKAFSQNIGHSSVVTTVSAYMPVSVERQGELIKKRNNG